MSKELIEQMLNEGVCPSCGSEIQMDEEKLTIYRCSENQDHFLLEVDFGSDGNTITAKLNGQPVDEEAVRSLNW